MRTFPDGFNITLVRHEKRPIAGYVQLEMNNTVYGMWGAALPETLPLRPAYLALWEIMRDAVENGFEFLDMGRSPAGFQRLQIQKPVGRDGRANLPDYLE